MGTQCLSQLNQTGLIQLEQTSGRDAVPAHLFCVSPANLSTSARWGLPSRLELPVAMAIAHDIALTYRCFICGKPRQPDRHPSNMRDRKPRPLHWSLGITPTSFRQGPPDLASNSDSHDRRKAPEQDKRDADNS